MVAKEAGYKIYCDCDVKVTHLVEPEHKPLLHFSKSEYTVDESMKIAQEMLITIGGILNTLHRKVKTVAQVIEQ